MHEKEPRKFGTEELVNKYFRDQEGNAAGTGFPEAGTPDGDFEKEKIYRNILAVIGRRKLAAGGKNAAARRRKPAARIFALKWQVVASLGIMLCLSLLAYQYRHRILNYIHPGRMLVREAAWGEIEIFTLSDGTKIWLNAGSRMTYPATFSGNSREISLEGEAYFDVAHNAGAPFIVHTANVTTRVLGTRFNISAYSGERNITVSVDQGKVGVSADAQNASGNTVLVMPRQQAVYNKVTRALTRDEYMDVPAAASWKQGKLAYRNRPLQEILADIERTYNVKIEAGSGIRNCMISADFNNDSLNKVLRILAELINGEVTEGHGTYFLTGTGCRNTHKK